LTGLQDRQNRDVKKIVAACGLKLEIRFAHKWINRCSQKISVTTQLSRDNYESTGSFFSLSFWLVQNPSSYPITFDVFNKEGFPTSGNDRSQRGRIPNKRE